MSFIDTQYLNTSFHLEYSKLFLYFQKNRLMPIFHLNVNPYPVKLIYSNFQPLEVVFRRKLLIFV